MNVELLWWLWTISNVVFYLIPPLLLYIYSWQKPRIKRIHAAFIAIFAGYIIGNVSTSLKWDYRRVYVNSLENPTSSQFTAATADGANLVFWLYAGWVPVAIYVLFCWWVLNILRKRNII
jgi:hypothetical protein